MIKKKVSLKDVIACLGESVISIKGIMEDRYVDNLSDSEHTIESTLDWVKPTNPHRQSIVENTPAKVIVVDESVVYNDIIKSQGKTLIVVNSPRNAIAKIGNRFFVTRPPIGIHPTAIVDEDAKIGDNVSIGPYTVIGKATIGDDTEIGAFTRIYDSCTIGNHCRISDHVVLGDEGFGFEKDEEGNWFKFPQLGSLEIGDYVHIGSYVCIDKGALSVTKVGDYTKIDSLCKIAHNAVVGKNVIMTGSCGCGGSSVVGDNVWMAPQSCIKDWCEVGEGAFVGMGSVVIRKVKPGTRVFGYPAKPFDL